MQGSVTISVTGSLRSLVLVWLVLLGASFLQDVSIWAGTTADKIWRLDVDFEGSLYTWYSGMLLLLVALASAVLARHEFAEHHPWRYHWLGIACLFVLLSMDETLALHEQLSGALSARQNVEGWLHFRWVVPAGLATLAFAVAYLRFLAHLPGRIALLMVTAGAMFVMGAIGMEVVAGKVVSGNAEALDGILYRVLTTIEEGLEAGGVILFLYALNRYCHAIGLDRLDISEVPAPVADFARTPAE